MASLMSMEDLFYGPPEATWILPSRDEFVPVRRYRDREFSPPRRFHQDEEPLRPVERYHPRPAMRMDDRDLRPLARARLNDEIWPVERRARVHTVPELVPVNAGHEEIRKVVEMPVPTAVPPPTQVVVAAPAPAPPPPVQVITAPAPAPPPPVQVITAPAPAPPPPVQVIKAPAPVPATPVQVVKRSISPPRAIIHHPIELKVPMCCEKCARKVKERLESLEGVENVVTDQYNQKVTVHGRVDPERVLNRVRLVKKRSAFWDMTVDYSDNYRRARQVEDAAMAREASKAAAAKAEAVAVAKSTKAAAMVAPAAPQVVVNLPQEQNGPKVTAILPPENESRRPYMLESSVHNHRYVSPPKAFRQEFFHGSARPEFYNGDRHPAY